MRASVVIPTRDRRPLLLPLLARVRPEAAAAGAEVVVVDNGSRDGPRAAGNAPRGDNMAFRRDALLAVRGFDERLGPRAGRPSVGEESEVCLRLRAAGWGVRYVPAAAVEHLVDPARLDPAWFLRRAFWTGWSEAMIDRRHRGLRAALGRFRWHYGRRLLPCAHT